MAPESSSAGGAGSGASATRRALRARRPVWTYVESGARRGRDRRPRRRRSGSEVRFRPRVLRGVAEVGPAHVACSASRSPRRSAWLRPPCSAPSTRTGERAMARGTAAAGCLHVVSSQRRHAVRRPRRTAPWWLQAYLPPDREADAAACSRRPWPPGPRAVVLTVDTPVPRDQVRRRRRRLDGHRPRAGGATNFDPEPRDARSRGRRPTSARRRRLAARAAGAPGGGQGRAPRRRRRPLPRRRCGGGLGVQPRRPPARPQPSAPPRPCAEVVAAVGGRGRGVRRRGRPQRPGRDGGARPRARERCSWAGRPLYALAVDGAAGVERLLDRALPTSSREALVAGRLRDARGRCATCWPADRSDAAPDLRRVRALWPGSRDLDLRGRPERPHTVLTCRQGAAGSKTARSGFRPRGDHPALRRKPFNRAELLRV